MVSNRQSHKKHEGSGKIPIQESKRSRGDTKQASISGIRNVINSLLLNDRHSYLEIFMRRVVAEEVERVIQGYLLSRGRVNHAGISGAKPFQLLFTKKLADTIFTMSKILAEDKSPLQIVLFDVRSQSVVNDGPLSSKKIEICALNGEFGSNGSEDLNEGEFNANIVRERDGKGPLLIGERFITLKNGVGCITKIIITDNSRWLRCRKFRLGAKVVEPTSSGENIKEGRSEPFVVKDSRGEPTKKHHPPSLNDEIWRLEKISKDGKIRQRLSLYGIHTVKDLLRLYITNASSLYEKLGNIQKKSWLAIIEHAKACVIDDYKLYGYYHTAEPPIGLLFNCIYIVVGVTFDGQAYHSPDALTPSEKHLVEIVKQHAYKNVNNLESIDETLLNCLNLAAFLKARQSDAPDQGVQQINISTEQVAYNGQQQTLTGHTSPIISASYIDEGMHNYQICADPLPDIGEVPPKSQVEDEFSSGMYTEGGSCWHLNGSHFPAMQCGYSTENETSEFQFINDYPPYTTLGLENGFFLCSDEAECSSHSPFLNSALDISNSEKPKAVWHKIRVALWVLSVRRDAAAKKKAKLFCYNY